MKAERWRQTSRLYHAALLKEASDRAAFVREACAGDDVLQREVESLLALDGSAENFMNTPAGGAAAKSMSDVHHVSLIGRQLGAYCVESLLGAGGMGEVYRARDTKLERDVAIKILPRIFGTEPARLVRFEREARMLASLNHPHIGAIYGLEVVDGMPALVLELIDGMTLAERLATGPLPVHEALTIAVQIADALEAAHEKGIVHRDLKPANVKITSEGTVKVLDFGLAKAALGGTGAALTQSPSVTPDDTREGAILGTVAYMSPEQAAGKPADKRSDLWAFGIVLFEMLTARPVFAGETMSHVLAAVLTTEPDWATLPAETPAPIRTLLRRCLEKDRKRRLESAADARLEIDDALTAPPAQGPVVTRLRPTWEKWSIAVTVLIVAVVAGTAVWRAVRAAEPVPLGVSRLPLALSGTAALTINGSDRDLTITPDGSRVIYVGNRRTQLFIRALDALEPVAVLTGLPREPFVSPDGQWIGFVDSNSVLKKVAMTGGPAVTLATLDTAPRGATWGPSDTIILATNNLTTGLLRIAAAGGPMTVLTRPDRAQGEADHLWPEMLPGGREVLFTITPVTGGLDAAQVAVLDLQTGARKVLVRGGSDAHYVPNGYLVYGAAGTLRAVPFDLARLETRGPSVPVVPAVVTTPAGAVDAVVAGDGTLAYVSGGVAVGVPHTLVWVDRQGREMPIPAPPRAYRHARLSPDGTRIALDVRDQEDDIWVWDLTRQMLTRLTFDPGMNRGGVWTPDGKRIVFSVARNGVENLYWQRADGSGAPELLTRNPERQLFPTSFSPDGTHLVFDRSAPPYDIALVTLDGGRPTKNVSQKNLLQTPFSELSAEISPDGRWLAYQSNESGRAEVYVRPFPDVNASRWQISTHGGTRPLWARNGRELFYLVAPASEGPIDELDAVPIQPGPNFAAGPSRTIFKGSYVATSDSRMYDVSPDGQRFLMIKEGRSANQTAVPPPVIVVQHWTEELKRLVPTK